MEADKIYSLSEIGDIVEKAQVECDCSTWKYGNRRKVLLKGRNIESYDHDGGIPVQGFKEKQWVYVHCDACGYDWALWKILNRMKRKVTA